MAEAARQKTADEQLIEDLSEFVYDPLGYVLYAWPWDFDKGEGPDKWQSTVLQEFGEALYKASVGKYREAEKHMAAVRIAVASGHGIGKSALIAWIIKFFMSTRPHPQVVTTANTKSQLDTKTWRELSKWNHRAADGHWFRWTATKFYHQDHPDTWFASAIPWSKEKSEAFAGTHEEHVLFLFDEASLIDDVIWEVVEGAMTTPGAAWIVFGNPTKNTGRFRECFGKYRNRWITHQIDSRTAKMVNKAQVEQWIEDYGDDSDFVRVRVKGQFPRASVYQLIPADIVEAAQAVTYNPPNEHIWSWSPIVIGVDPARFGDDRSVIYIRQGLQTHRIDAYMEIDTQALADKVMEAIKEWKPRTVFIDGVGVGAGVVDRLKRLGYGDMLIEVNVGVQANRKEKYFNKRAEIWVQMKEWLKSGGSIPADDQELYDDLIGPEYGYDNKDRIQLEKKEDMKERGLSSPDKGDALAITFFAPIPIEETKKPKTRAEEDWEIVTNESDYSTAYNIDDGFED